MSPIDSAGKRKAADGEQEPIPDATIDEKDRGQIAGEYFKQTTGGAPALHGGYRLFGEPGCATFKKT